jgi:amino acid adenylation domain-containing protein/thioester reductase-like protein
MEKDFYELTNPQKSIWYTEEVFKGTPMANITATVIIPEEVNFKLLEKAINILVEKNDNFRIKISVNNGKTCQYIEKYDAFKLNVINVASDEELKVKSREIADTPFDVLNSTLFDFRLVKFPDNHGGFIIRMHHLISDAWSGVFDASEIVRIYSFLIKNEDTSNISYPSYVEYIKSEQEYIQSDRFVKDKTFWNSLFEILPEIASIPCNNNSTHSNSIGASIRKQFTISNDLIQKINLFCKDKKISIFNFFMAVFSIYLGKVSSLDEFVIGTPILNRSNAKEKRTSGMFINTIPLKISLNNSMTFVDLASYISSSLFNMFKHQKYSYLSLLEDLRVSNGTIPNLYDVFISYQNVRSSSKDSDVPFDIQWVHSNYTSDSLDIHIFDMNDSGDFNIAYDYQTIKYAESDISNIHKRIIYIIHQVLDNTEVLLSNIDIVTPEEKQKIIVDFNNYTLKYDSSKSIKQLFENQVDIAPNDIAIVYKGNSLSYKELNEKANMLSHYLIKQEIKKGDVIPVLLDRSIDLIISMIAIIKTGAIYLPISSDCPSERLSYIIENSKAKIVITSSTNNLVNTDSVSTILLDTFNYSNNSSKNTLIEPSANDVLYIIYTSGSTGNPKGVRITNQNLNNFVNNFQNYFGGITSSDKCLASTNIGFDVSIFEFFTTLLSGATLYLYEENTITDIFKYCKDIVQNNITLLYIPPNILEEVYSILSSYTNVSINKILIGVEPISSETMKKYYTLNPNIKIVNAYGPTETTICSTAIVLNEEILNKYSIIPIGMPLNNLKLFILDKNLKPVPISTPGELYITGDNVGKGYLNNRELTESSFIKLPDNLSKSTAYKTGDLAKWNYDGSISFISRKDNQVKINGHRIELGEIESCIYRYPNIEKSIVLIDEKQKIIAYFSSEKNINISDLRAFLQRKLPSYFIPNTFIQVTKFKLTSNGKIDKRALAKIKVEQSVYEAPKTDCQKQLAQIFETVLGYSQISINDNFFEIGGDSLSAIKLQIEAFNKNINISYKDIFTYPTIKLLSKHISQSEIPVEENIEEVYDYSKINNLISKNKDHNKPKLQKSKIKNILLTGATGYMGSHVLDDLLKHTRCNIYCLVRGKNKTDPQTRLTDVLRFYFGSKYDKLIFKRIFVIEGDVTKSKLGLNDLYYDEVGKSISCVINCAAIVKHYGNSDIFNNINIKGTQNIIDFCLKFNCKLMHMSTLSVSGNMLGEGKSADEVIKLFTERKLYIGQDLSNIYIKTKFLAERLILENILSKNLNAKIVRLGNITNRFSDGAFQINVSENAFLNKLHSFLEIGCIPEKFRNLEVEFSPVDLCASAIVNLTLYENPFTIFHISHNNHISFEKLVRIFNSMNVKLEFVTEDVFNKKVENLSKNSETKNLISGIINDFDKNKHLNYTTDTKIDTSFTAKYLKRLSFKWPKINEKYLRKYIVYLKSIGYINL